MSITFSCDQCGKRYKADETLTGRTFMCRECGREFNLTIAGQPARVRNSTRSTAARTEPRRRPANREREISTYVAWGAGIIFGVIGVIVLVSLLIVGLVAGNLQQDDEQLADRQQPGGGGAAKAVPPGVQSGQPVLIWNAKTVPGVWAPDFTMDYKFQRGGPEKDMTYILVVEYEGGDIRFDFGWGKFGRQGTLRGKVTGARFDFPKPPFKCYLEKTSFRLMKGERISDTIAVDTSATPDLGKDTPVANPAVPPPVDANEELRKLREAASRERLERIKKTLEERQKTLGGPQRNLPGPPTAGPFGGPPLNPGGPPSSPFGRPQPMIPGPIAAPPTAPPPAAMTQAELPPLTDKELVQALKYLKSRRRDAQSVALQAIARTPPNERREEVAAALLRFVNDRFFGREAIKALGTWGTEKSSARLIEMMGKSDWVTRALIIESLGKLKEERAAEPIAQYLPEDVRRAGDALISIGSAAEEPVAKLLSHSNWTVRLEACRILKEIGTAESQEALTALSEEENGSVRDAAEQALKAIDSRSEQSEDEDTAK